MKGIRNSIQSFFDLTDSQLDVYLSAFHKCELKKGDSFLNQGEICNKVGLIEKGLMKISLLRKGKEVIYEFAYEDNFVTDYYSFLKTLPSRKEIVCLEDTTVYVCKRETIHNLALEFPFLFKMQAKINEFLFLKLHERLEEQLVDTMEMRYEKLISERKDLADRIPQYLLASYLNIQPETVSRIRKRRSLPKT